MIIRGCLEKEVASLHKKDTFNLISKTTLQPKSLMI